jgi:hypothetical protein
MRSPFNIAFVSPLLFWLIQHSTEFISNDWRFDVALIGSFVVLGICACLEAVQFGWAAFSPKDDQPLQPWIARLAWPTLLCSALLACLAADVWIASTRSVAQTISVTREFCSTTHSKPAMSSSPKLEIDGQHCFFIRSEGVRNGIRLDASKRQGDEVPLHQVAWVRLKVSDSFLLGQGVYFFAPKKYWRATVRD